MSWNRNALDMQIQEGWVHLGAGMNHGIRSSPVHVLCTAAYSSCLILLRTTSLPTRFPVLIMLVLTDETIDAHALRRPPIMRGRLLSDLVSRTRTQPNLIPIQIPTLWLTLSRSIRHASTSVGYAPSTLSQMESKDNTSTCGCAIDDALRPMNKWSATVQSHSQWTDRPTRRRWTNFIASVHH